MRALFLTWDGPQQSYLESLFFPLFAGLRQRAIEIHTLQLTWSTQGLNATAAAAERLGLRYASRVVPEALRKLALPAVVGYGAAAAARYASTERIDTLMPRSLLPMAMALLLPRRPGRTLAFEADGFMADERIDFGGWSSRGLPYRALRAVEAAGVRRARSVICRTEAAREMLIERAGGAAELRSKIFVAPNAKDAQLFAPGSDAERAATRSRHGIEPDAPWVVYVGSIGPQYCPEAMLQTFRSIWQRAPRARLSCFTLHEARLSALVREQGLPPDLVQVGRASPAEIPGILAASDLGLALRQQAPSQQGICPIKVAEYLLCGVPVLTSRVGDLERQLGQSPAALVVDSSEPDLAERAAAWFVDQVLPERPKLREAARQLGLEWFELSRSIETYASMLHHAAGEGRV